MTSDVQVRIGEILNEVANVRPEDVSPDKAFVADLGIDSLDAVNIMLEVEQKFHVEIPDEHDQLLMTVGDLVAYIDKQRDPLARVRQALANKTGKPLNEITPETILSSVIALRDMGSVWDNLQTTFDVQLSVNDVASRLRSR